MSRVTIRITINKTCADKTKFVSDDRNYLQFLVLYCFIRQTDPSDQNRDLQLCGKVGWPQWMALNFVLTLNRFFGPDTLAAPQQFGFWELAGPFSHNQSGCNGGSNDVPRWPTDEEGQRAIYLFFGNCAANNNICPFSPITWPTTMEHNDIWQKRLQAASLVVQIFVTCGDMTGFGSLARIEKVGGIFARPIISTANTTLDGRAEQPFHYKRLPDPNIRHRLANGTSETSTKLSRP